jgi:hypothetical protein
MLYIASHETHEYSKENIKQYIFDGMKSKGLQSLAFKFTPPPQIIVVL